MSKKLLRSVIIFWAAIAYKQSFGQENQIGDTVNRISNQTIKVKADFVSSFNRGFAAIQKGTQFALIDRSGKLVIPFGKYTEFAINAPWYYINSGIFEVKDKVHPYGMFINADGKILYAPPVESDYINFYASEDGRTYGVTERSFLEDGSYILRDVYFDRLGHKIYLQYPSEAKWANDSCVYRDPSSGLFGFASITGQKFIPPKYPHAQNFSEGIAAVLKKNSWGPKEWMFIDVKGEPVTQKSFRNEVGKFGNGLAFIYDSSERSACINKKGEVIFTFNHGSVFEPRFNRKFENGLYWGHHDDSTFILTIAGGIYLLQDFIDSLGIDSNVFSNARFERIKEQHIYFGTGGHKHGALNMKTKEFAPAIFDVLSDFDSISGLAYAEQYVAHGNDFQGWQIIRGFVNDTGFFVIIFSNDD